MISQLSEGRETLHRSPCSASDDRIGRRHRVCVIDAFVDMMTAPVNLGGLCNMTSVRFGSLSPLTLTLTPCSPRILKQSSAPHLSLLTPSRSYRHTKRFANLPGRTIPRYSVDVSPVGGSFRLFSLFSLFCLVSAGVHYGYRFGKETGLIFEANSFFL